MSLNSGEEDYDYLSKLQDQNGRKYKDAAEEIEDCGKRKGKQAKENMQRKVRKRKVEETEKDGNDKKDWNDNSLTSNERMNGIACWIKHVGWHLQMT